MILATRNPHKLVEFRRVLGEEQVMALPPAVALGPETGETFAQNALDKARTAAAATGLVAIADDSGIAAAALDGAPGGRSAGFADARPSGPAAAAAATGLVAIADDSGIAAAALDGAPGVRSARFAGERASDE